ncbi:hypothetical protein FNV43_RR19627 [Rhamnella rubrinervis]|uniref:Uncharacterized protein n=1 Tax=Rhamnella rubrinervis TaxID=2594499 RepID=A0A8K0DZ57_9ROSA|nr:hypothetical protein FNV43_RR19627 [Rhamnella rubrinervis]
MLPKIKPTQPKRSRFHILELLPGLKANSNDAGDFTFSLRAEAGMVVGEEVRGAGGGIAGVGDAGGGLADGGEEAGRVATGVGGGWLWR